jgi:hypothetical protein
MRWWPCAVALLAAAGGGAQEATYLVRGDQMPKSVVANGYVQLVTARSPNEALVRVATARVPVGAEGSYDRVRQSRAPEVPEGFQIPRTLRSDLRPELDAWEAATEVLKWVAVNLGLADGSEAQDAAAVLRRGYGRCSGIANATAALLLAAGFEARTVSGVLVTENGVVPHRWVECRLPQAGWVPTDPTLGLWTLTPSHMAFPDTVTAMPQVEIVATGRDFLESLPRWKGRPVRPNAGSTLMCRLAAGGVPDRATAILYGAGGDVRRATLGPEGRFDQLLPGWWRLVIEVDGEIVEERRLRLQPAQSHTFTVTSTSLEHRSEVGS